MVGHIKPKDRVSNELIAYKGIARWGPHLQLALGTVVLLAVLPSWLIDSFAQFDRGEENWAIARVIVACLFVGVSTFAYLYVPSQVRASRLRKSAHSGQVFSARVDGETVRTLSKISGGSTPHTVGTVAALFDAHGISLWGGVFSPRVITRIEWAQIANLDVIVTSEGRRVNVPWLRINREDVGDELHLGIMSERRVGWDLLSAADHKYLLKSFSKEIDTT